MLTSNSGHPAFSFLVSVPKCKGLVNFYAIPGYQRKVWRQHKNFRNFIVVFRQQEDCSWRAKFSSLPSTMNQNYDNLSNDEQDDLKSATLLEVTA